MMTPKEKAKQLIGEFQEYASDVPFKCSELINSKKCALIAVNEILQLLKRTSNENIPIYWVKVKKEIQKL